MGFGRACAPVRFTHPSFGLIAVPKGRCAPPRPSQLRCFSTQRINGNYTKIMYRCVHTPCLFSFYSCFYIVFFLSFLFVNLFLLSPILFSSYSSLLILLFWSLLILLYVGKFSWKITVWASFLVVRPPIATLLIPPTKLLIYRENPSKILVWQKIRQIIPLLI